ncbi:MAG: hypothetical protein OXI65_07790 [Acidobacteriota bacterium]|nr:hypothetical protein [Acidobacteriota bacterium]
MPRDTLRAELYRLLFDDRQGAAAFLAPRMLADPQSLTPEVRWCLIYLLRGIRSVAASSRLLEPDSVLHLVAHTVEAARRTTAGIDGHWYEIARELPGHWLRRYERGEVRYSLDELRYLNVLLARLWFVERQRIAFMDPPLLPRYLRPEGTEAVLPAG